MEAGERRAKERVVDVSDLEPPEPLERVLEAAATLKDGEYLRMLHRREPLLLYPELAGRGFAYSTRKGRGAAFEILIWREGDALAGQTALAAAAEA